MNDLVEKGLQIRFESSQSKPKRQVELLMNNETNAKIVNNELIVFENSIDNMREMFVSCNNYSMAPKDRKEVLISSVKDLKTLDSNLKCQRKKKTQL